MGFVVHTSAFTAIGRLFRENSGFSEILTRTLGTITCAGRGWGNLQACHRRARTFGSQPPSGSYSRRVALSDHRHRYAGKTLVSEKQGDKYDRKCTFPYRKGMPRVPSSAGYFFRLSGVGDPVGFVVHTSAFTAHRSAIPGKLWFLGNFNSNIGHYNMCR